MSQHQHGNTSVRYAAQGIAFDCLTTGLLIDRNEGPHEGLPANVSYYDFRAGSIVCPTERSTVPGRILAAILISEHILAILLPLLLIPRFYRRTVGRTVVKSGGHLLFGMGMLGISSFGEVAQHVHDNWLYAGLYNSFYNTVFHSALCFGQALLTAGVAGAHGGHNARNAAFCGLSTASMVLGTVATAEAKNPPLLLGLTVQQVVWPVVFAMLTLVTGSFVLHAYRCTEDVRHTVYALPTVAMYVVGVVAASMIASSGNQWWHLGTAFSFLLGYVAQTLWVRRILATEPVREHKS